MTTPRSFAVTATVGPASSTIEVLEAMVPLATRLRINGAHTGVDGLITWLDRLRTIFARVGRSIPVVVDCQAAKMRIGPYGPVEALPEQVVLVLDEGWSGDPREIPVPHERLFRAVTPGEELGLHDGRVLLSVQATTPASATCRVLRGGPLGPYKGINRTTHPIPYDELEPRDRALLLAALPYPFTEAAVSFVHTGREADLFREVWPRRLAAKIERPEAFHHLAAIAHEFDEAWLCRGDLGAQAGLARLGALQDQFVTALGPIGVDYHLAGEVLEHMTTHRLPTRTEVVHLHHVASAGFAGVVLSDETAVGVDPVNVVSTTREVAYSHGVHCAEHIT